MVNKSTEILKAFLKDRSEKEIDEIATKFGFAKTTEEIMEINKEYNLGISEANCKKIADNISSSGSSAVPLDDLETVVGGIYEQSELEYGYDCY